MTYTRYTVTKRSDADLAGTEGRLVMHFVDGSLLEVSLEEVVKFVHVKETELCN